MQRARAGRRRWALLSLLLGPRRRGPGPRQGRHAHPLGPALALGRHRRRLSLPRPAARPAAGRQTLFLDHDSFAGHGQQSGGGWARARQEAPALGRQPPLLPTSNKGQFAQCAAGAFDGSFRQIGANLKAAGAQGTVVRLGWEANIGSDSHPWGVDTADQVPAYKACWRRAAAALKAGGPGLNIEWTSAKKTQNTALHVLDMYPGDDVVDVVGVHYYDSGPEKNTQALWDKYYNITFNGGPWGLGTWLAFAKAHGKQLGIAEWGLWRQGGLSAAQADDPVYIDNMYRFFRANAGRHRLRDLLQRDGGPARAVQRQRDADELPEGGRDVQGRLEPGRPALTPEARAQSLSRGRR